MTPSIRDCLRAAGAESGAADADLLARFAATRDESAFELLVWRHAALVQRVCRAVLHDRHAAEDAAQATFLVLARKAHTFAGRGSVVGWLYRVARRAAVRLARQRGRAAIPSATLDRVAAAAAEPGVSPDESAALCAEIDRLPDRYRVPVLLCFFEGLTHAEAARRTGWPVGTVAGRLARAKDLLARRLSRKGVGLAAVATVAPSGDFVGATAHAAAAFACRTPVVPGVGPGIVAFAEGVSRAMTATTLKFAAAAAAVLCAVTAGGWGLTVSAAPTAPVPAADPPTAATGQPPAAGPKPPAPKDRTADATQRTRSQNNLKQILLALHNYESTFGHLPHDIADKDGKPLLSWRVAILPYVEEENLYRQFKLDEPWDSENNKRLLAEMPDLYRVGFEPKDATKTHYQAFAGPGTMFEPGTKVKLSEIIDGTSNTVAVVEAGPPVEWTRPADIPYDPKKPLKLELPFKNVLFAGAGDGAVHSLRPDPDEQTLRRLIERGDGEVVSFDDVRGAKFSLSPEEVKATQEGLKQSEKLLGQIAEQLREQQKLLAELVKNRKPDDPVAGIDPQRVADTQKELEAALEAIKKQTEELRKELKGDKQPLPAKPKD